MNSVIGLCFALFCWTIIVEGFPDFNFSMSNFRVTTGKFQMKAYLDHVGKEPWDIYIKKNTDPRNSLSYQAITIVENNFKDVDDLENDKIKKVPITSTGYQMLKGLGYYKLQKDKKTWQQALEACEKEETHLLIVNSEEEAEAILLLMLHEDTLKQYHWIGFHGHFQDNWYTITNKTIQAAGYSKWYSTAEPNSNPGQGQCGLFRYDSSTLVGLLDWGCDNLAFFICELELE
ncbi:hypothetical protein C0J52_00973 [Blattella germanica]|nr:hypothetical protein C0J52_00973 [Blattella germanica]